MSEFDYKYQEHLEDSLGYKRKDMPQIDFEVLPEFLVHFVEKSVGVKKVVKKLKELKPSQDEFNEDKLLAKLASPEEQFKNRYYLISSEGYLADAHHDWAHGLEIDENYGVTCFQFDIPAKELLKRAKLLKITNKRTLDDKIVKALELLEEGVALGLVPEEDLQKAKSKYGEGVKVINVQVKGKKKVFTRKQKVGTTTKKKPKAHWSDKYKEYNLNKYPIGIPQKDVTINFEGDINSHAVMSWRDPKTGKLQQSYTREFLHRNAMKKWKRIEQITADDITGIKKKAIDIIVDKKANESDKQSAAILYVIAETGLRIGDAAGFANTGNRGMTTLAVENVKVKGSVVDFEFVGKSYKDNTATISNEFVANYLKGLKKGKEKEDFLFDVNRVKVSKVFKDTMGMEDFKIKDLRTYVATDKAREILYTEPSMPPPLTGDQKKDLKLVKDKLKNVFELVSQQLNNTPAMAKSSYVHPVVIETWLVGLGLSMDIVKAEGTQMPIPTLDEIIAQNKKRFAKVKVGNLNEEDEELCDEYPLPDFFLKQNDVFMKAEELLDLIEAGGEWLLPDIVKAHGKSHLIKTKVWNKKGHWQTVYVSPEEYSKLKHNGKLRSDADKAAEHQTGDAMAVYNAIKEVLESKHKGVEDIIVHNDGKFNYSIGHFVEKGTWYKTKNFDKTQVIGIKDDGKTHEKKLKPLSAEEGAKIAEEQEKAAKAQELMDELEQVLANGSGTLQSFNGFDVGDTVGYASETQNLDGKIKTIKYHSKYDKFGTAVFEDSDSGKVYSKSLKKLHNYTKEAHGEELVEKHGNTVAMLGNNNAAKQGVGAAPKTAGKPIKFDETTMNDADFKVVKSLGGSNGAVLVEDKQGKKYVRKKFTGASAIPRVKNEMTAARMYKTMGLNVPQIYTNADGDSLYSEYLGDDWEELGDIYATFDKKDRDKIDAEIRKGYAADALMANWDVVGMNSDNIMVNKNTLEVARIDLGGALYYRAQGAPKGSEFDNNMFEFANLKNGNINSKTSAFYKDVTKSEELAQLEKIVAVAPQLKQIGAVMDEVGKGKDIIAQRIDRVINRHKFMKAHEKDVPTTKHKFFDLTGDKEIDAILHEADKSLVLTPQDKQLVDELESSGKEYVEYALKHGSANRKSTITAMIDSGMTYGEIQAVISFTGGSYGEMNDIMASLSNGALGNINLAKMKDGSLKEAVEQAQSTPTTHKKYAVGDSHPQDIYMTPIVAAAKTVNFHKNDHDYNEHTMNQLKDTIKQLEGSSTDMGVNPKNYSAADKKMVAHYLNLANQVMASYKAKKEAPMVEAYKLNASQAEYMTKVSKDEWESKYGKTKKTKPKGETVVVNTLEKAQQQNGHSLTVRAKMAAAGLNKAKKNPTALSKQQNIYRKVKYITGAKLATFLKQHEVGDRVLWQRFSSTSTDKSTWSGNISFTIKHKNGVSVEHISNHPNEKEVLLPPFTFIKVNKVEHQGGDNYHFIVEEL